jgi:type VI protein secretion system component Hcp
MNTVQRIATAAFSILALTSATATLAAPPLPSVGTLTMPAPFGPSPVLAWSFGASNSGSTHVGGGGGAGKVNVQDISMTRYVDAQSPLFFNAVATGQHLPTVVLVDGSTNITLTDVLVTSYSTGDGGSDKSSRTENLSLNFAKITYAVNGVAVSACASDACAP